MIDFRTVRTIAAWKEWVDKKIEGIKKHVFLPPGIRRVHWKDNRRDGVPRPGISQLFRSPAGRRGRNWSSPSAPVRRWNFDVKAQVNHAREDQSDPPPPLFYWHMHVAIITNGQLFEIRFKHRNHIQHSLFNDNHAYLIIGEFDASSNIYIIYGALSVYRQTAIWLTLLIPT